MEPGHLGKPLRFLLRATVPNQGETRRARQETQGRRRAANQEFMGGLEDFLIQNAKDRAAHGTQRWGTPGAADGQPSRRPSRIRRTWQQARVRTEGPLIAKRSPAKAATPPRTATVKVNTRRYVEERLCKLTIGAPREDAQAPAPTPAKASTMPSASTASFSGTPRARITHD